MARKSVRSLLLTALLATPLLSYATQYPLTVTDLDGRQVTSPKSRSVLFCRMVATL